jgi:hypothetical protein
MNANTKKLKHLFNSLTILLLIALSINSTTIALANTLNKKTTIQPAHQTTTNRSQKPSAESLQKTFNQLPLTFEANHGQTDNRVKFLSRGNGYTLFLTADQAALQLHNRKANTENRQPSTSMLSMKLVGANAQAQVKGLDPLDGKVSYFLGDNPESWTTDVVSYKKVEYAQVYPGIDLLYYGNQEQLEYDFKLAAHADYKNIALNFSGAENITIASNGDLILQTASGDVHHKRPYAYQEIDGNRRTIDSAYLLKGENQIGFQLGKYDENYPLVIDPVLSYATYFGGNGEEVAYDITVDDAGNTYVTGQTNSVTFPFGAIQNSGGTDVFIAKFAPSGSAYYGVFFGGSGNEAGTGIALTSTGDVYVSGFTTSVNFPKVNAYDNTLNGATDAFVVKFNSQFNAFLYATYFGGSDLEDTVSISLDSSQDIYISGRTGSANLPVMNAAQPNYGGQGDAFVAKLNSLGNTLLYSTYLGGSSPETPYGRGGMAIDNFDNVYIAGGTYSLNFPRKNAYQQNKGENNNLLDDAFITRINTASTGNASLIYSTYIGGSTRDYATDIALDSAGNVFVTGQTASDNFPKLNPLQPTRAGGFDAFLLKLNAIGNALLYSTYFGSSSDDIGTGVKVNATGEAFITGSVGQAIPGINAMKPYHAGSDAFLAKVNAAGSAVTFLTYFGGNNADVSESVALDPAGNAYVAGQTQSIDFAKVNALQATYGGSQSDTFVARIETDTPDSIEPVIANVYISGKRLYVEGINFDIGARLYLNGQKQKKVFNDEQTPTTRIFAAKAGKQIPPGSTVMVQVENTNGTLSKLYFFTHGVQ